MAKLLENTFRHVNIALVNEMAVFCRELDIDLHDVIAAAATKPFGFMPFYPGPGVGGHCIPVDPSYLSWRVRQLGTSFRFVELAQEINARMPSLRGHAADRPAQRRRPRAVPGERAVPRDRLQARAWRTAGSRRRSRSAPARRQGRDRVYGDPHVPAFEDLTSVPLDDAGRYDAVVVLTPHAEFDLARVAERRGWCWTPGPPCRRPRASSACSRRCSQDVQVLGPGSRDSGHGDAAVEGDQPTAVLDGQGEQGQVGDLAGAVQPAGSTCDGSRTLTSQGHASWDGCRVA